MAKSSKTSNNGGFFKSLTKSIVYLIVLVAAIVYAPYCQKLSYRSRKADLMKSFDSPLKENDLLSKAEKLFAGEFVGPESLASYQGDLYTGVQDGRILRIRNGRYEVVTTIGNGTCPPWQEKVCGRPLGNRITTSGILYTIDAYHGLVKTDLKEKQPKPKVIFSSETKVDGQASLFLDDVTIDETGSPSGNIFYMSDASKVWELHEVVVCWLDQDDTGRIIKFNEATGKATVIMSNLAFPNGVQLTDDKSALLVSELGRKQILKHYLEGPKAGKTEILVKLPGDPDNIRRSSRKDMETYWIALATARTAEKPLLPDRLEDKPFLRNFVIKLCYSVGTLIKSAGELFKISSLIQKGWEIRGLDLKGLVTMPGMALEIDSKGNIITCLHSPDGRINLLSEVREVQENGKKVLYLGSVYNKYLGRLVLN